jgi:hypothetical protein
MSERPARRGLGWTPVRALNGTIYILVALLLTGAISRAIPPSHITIATGPIGGSYSQHAPKYKQELQSRGIAVTLRPDPDSVKIISHVEAAQPATFESALSSTGSLRAIFPT